MSRHGGRRSAPGRAGLAVVAVLAALAAGCAAEVDEPDPVRPVDALTWVDEVDADLTGVPMAVGSQEGIAEELLGWIAVETLTAAGVDVTEDLSLGDSRSTREALLAGLIDLTWETTGTGWLELLREIGPSEDPAQLYDDVRDEDLDENGVVWLDPADADAGLGVVATPEVTEDLGIETLSDLARALAELDEGVVVCVSSLRRPLDRRTWAGAGNPTSAALDALARAGVDRGVFRREAIVGGTAPVTEPVVVTGAAGQQIDATLSDPALRAHVNATGDPVLAAHRALADLALLSGPPEEGGIATGTGDAGVVLELAPNRPLPAAFLDALLRGLGEPGPVRAVNLSALFDADPAGEPGPEPGPQVQGISVAGQDLTTYGNNLSLTRTALGGYESFAGAADPVAVELRRRLLVSGSIDLTEQQRGNYLRATTETIRARTEQVEIADDEAVTLTSREGDIPVTILNDTGAEVEVEVVFDSDNRLDFPEGSRQRVRLTEGTNRLEVPVVARASGSFPLRITATSPDGVLTVSRARVTVRSQALSGVGLVLSVGALLVLAAWWLSHWRTTRRNRRLVDPEDLPVDTTPLADRGEDPGGPSSDDPDPPEPDEPASTEPPVDADGGGPDPAPDDPGGPSDDGGNPPGPPPV